MNIVVANRQRAKKINARLMKEITSAILADLEMEHCELEINLVGAREMAALNEVFLHHRGSTDVITFDYSEGGKSRPNVGVSGEIFVSIDDAVLQAKQFKTSWQSELVRYAVHGILHLIGFDDLRAKPRQKMKREENRLLRELSRRFALSKLSGQPRLSAWNRKICSRAGVPVS